MVGGREIEELRTGATALNLCLLHLKDDHLALFTTLLHVTDGGDTAQSIVYTLFLLIAFVQIEFKSLPKLEIVAM